MLHTIKGTTVGWDEKSLSESNDALGMKLISLCETFTVRYTEAKDVDEREYGIIRKAANGLTNDIHNLSIIIDMMESIIQNENLALPNKNHLYLSVYLENYYTNLRSVFDFIPNIIRICLTEKEKLGLPQSDSYNKLLKYVKNENNKTKLPEELLRQIKKGEKVFNVIKSTRDSIIHKGDDPIIFQNGNEFSFAILKFDVDGQENTVENILNTKDLKYPIIEYLSKLTNMVMDFLEELAYIMYCIWCEKENERIGIWLSALVGICMPNFIRFLGLAREE